MDELRICKTCGIEDLVTNFANAGKVRGKQYYRHVCKSCYYKSKKAKKKEKRDYILEVKKNSICEVCGFSDYRALHFHHRIPEEKEFELANASRLGYSIDKINKEIEKCSIICANCHAIEHFNN